MLSHRVLRYVLLCCLFSYSFSSWSQQSATETLTPEAIEEIAHQAAEQAAKQAAESAAKQIAEKAAKAQQQTTTSATTLTNTDKPMLNSGLAPTRLRIGSGAVGGNYFVLGELVGGAISHPRGSLPCGQGGTCGVRGLQSENVTSAGSIANLTALQDEKITTAFVQSDVAYWAYTGTGLFINKDAQKDLRAIASLYPEAIHIVIRKGLGIKTVADLRNRRVSVGARKSGTLLQSRLVLAAYQLSEDDLKTEYLNNQQSIEKLKNKELDAMFFSVGAPAPALTQLFTDSKEFTLLSLGTPQQQDIFRQGHYFLPYTIAADTYPNSKEVKTISVYALWLCSADLDEDLVYQVTKALWSEASRQLLGSSYIGQQVKVKQSLNGIGIPLHDGAKRYYNEIGKRF